MAVTDANVLGIERKEIWEGQIYDTIFLALVFPSQILVE